jgi:hypothetical protein
VAPFHQVLTLAASVPHLADAIAQTIQRLPREGFLEQIEPPDDAAASNRLTPAATDGDHHHQHGEGDEAEHRVHSAQVQQIRRHQPR